MKCVSVSPFSLFFGELTVDKRIDLSAELDALVAHHYGLNRSEYSTIIGSYQGFEEVFVCAILWLILCSSSANSSIKN
jgi:hypothetical protein